MESTLFSWLMAETVVIVLTFVIFGDAIKRGWAEVRRLRAEKEALTKVLIAFLKGQIEKHALKESSEGRV